MNTFNPGDKVTSTDPRDDRTKEFAVIHAGRDGRVELEDQHGAITWRLAKYLAPANSDIVAEAVSAAHRTVTIELQAWEARWVATALDNESKRRRGVAKRSRWLSTRQHNNREADQLFELATTFRKAASQSVTR